MDVLEEIIKKVYEMMAISAIIDNPQFLIMYALAFVLLYLGIKKEFEPLLLVPIAFGVLIANFPGGDMGVTAADSKSSIACLMVSDFGWSALIASP